MRLELGVQRMKLAAVCSDKTQGRGEEDVRTQRLLRVDFVSKGCRTDSVITQALIMKRKRKKHLLVEWRAVEMIERYSQVCLWSEGRRRREGRLRLKTKSIEGRIIDY